MRGNNCLDHVDMDNSTHVMLPNDGLQWQGKYIYSALDKGFLRGNVIKIFLLLLASPPLQPPKIVMLKSPFTYTV